MDPVEGIRIGHAEAIDAFVLLPDDGHRDTVLKRHLDTCGEGSVRSEDLRQDLVRLRRRRQGGRETLYSGAEVKSDVCALALLEVSTNLVECHYDLPIRSLRDLVVEGRHERFPIALLIGRSCAEPCAELP